MAASAQRAEITRGRRSSRAWHGACSKRLPTADEGVGTTKEDIMNSRVFASSAVALAALLVSSAAYAQGGPGRRGRGGHGMGHGPRVMQQLDLSEDQQAQIQQLRREAREESSAAREDLQQLRGELQQLWQADQPDASAILAKQGQMDALRSVVRARRTELRMDIQGILTAEQRARMAEVRAERRAGGGGEGRMGRRGRGRGHGGPGMGGPGMGARGMRGMADRLDLSAEQQSQIRALRQQARQSTSDERSAIQQIRQEVRAQWASGQPDETAIDELQERASAARSAIREQRVHTRIEVLDILDAEQRAAMQELRQQRQERRAARHGRGLGRGAGRGLAQ